MNAIGVVSIGFGVLLALFLGPVVLHSFLSGASMSRIHGEVRDNLPTKILLSISTLLGVVIASLVGVPLLVSNILVSLIAGILLYVIAREFLPEKKDGRPFYFIIGLAVFMGISLLLNNGNHQEILWVR
jgi:zinc transporter ZupT